MIMIIAYAIMMTIAVMALLAFSAACVFLAGLFFKAVDAVIELFNKRKS